MAQHLVANFQSQWQAAMYAIAISLCATCKNQLTPSAQFVPLFVQETAEKQPLSISCWCCAARQARTCISCCFLFTTRLSPLFWKKVYSEQKMLPVFCLLLSSGSNFEGELCIFIESQDIALYESFSLTPYQSLP